MKLSKMDCRLGQDKQDLQKRVSDFCTEHCPPSVATALEQSGEFPAELYAAMAMQGMKILGGRAYLEDTSMAR